jgi:hypothetical protein
MSEGHTNNPPGVGKLLALTLGAGVAATLLTVAVVLPAEFGRDPTGIGALTGLNKLSGPAGHMTGEVARYYNVPFRSDVLEIPFVPAGDKTGLSQLEYKVRMAEGQTLIYSWEAEGAADGEFYFDLHTETPDEQVIEFKQETGTRSDGALTAPVDGVHGWYWQNRSANPVTVRLKISGFYELIPPGETGNKAGILPAAGVAAPDTSADASTDTSTKNESE